MRKYLLIAISALLLFAGCSKNEESSATALESLQIIPPAQITVSDEGGDVKATSVAGKGPLATDNVVLRQADGTDIVIPIKSIATSSFTFSIPAGLQSGKYMFCIERNGKVREFQSTNVTVTLVIPDSGPYIYGVVTCESKPLAGVVVSDGFACTTTDGKGRYSLKSPCPERTRFAFASIPTGYEPVMSSGFPVFFTKLDAYKNNKPREANIVLAKASRSQDEYNIVFSADPQVRPRSSTWHEQYAFSSEAVLTDYFAHLKDIGASSSCPCYGIVLGDVAYNYPESFASYQKLIPTVGYPYFSVIGNHDHIYKNASSDDESAIQYENVFGPRNYSINIGGVHYVCLDDIMYVNKDGSLDYERGIEDEFMEWLRQDLSYVPNSTPLMICAHAPISGISGFDKGCYNLDKLKKLLSSRGRVYFWAGHVHQNRCGVYATDGITVESHTLARSTGALGSSEYTTSDGVPRGVVVMNVKNGKFTWQFTPNPIQTANVQSTSPQYRWRNWNYVGNEAVMKDGSGKLDTRHQLHAYPRGAYGDDYVYANVFLWDDLWGKPVLTINGQKYTMELNGAYDLGYKEVLHHYQSVNTKVAAQDSDHAASPVYHAFGVRVPADASGEGEVSVKDRFGNVYSQKVSVDPIKYTDGNLHLTFDTDRSELGWPTSEKSNVSVSYTIGNASYALKMSKGYFNGADKCLVLSAKGSYLTLPAVPGYKLTGVIVRMAGNSDFKDRSAIISSDTAGTSAVKGGEELLFTGNCSDDWNLSGTTAGKEYYLVAQTAVFTMGELRLTYSK